MFKNLKILILHMVLSVRFGLCRKLILKTKLNIIIWRENFIKLLTKLQTIFYASFQSRQSCRCLRLSSAAD